MLLNEFLENTARTTPDKLALVCQKNRLNYREIDDMASSFSGALISEGFQRQDRAAVYLDNSVESVVSLFGILKAGGVFVLINPKIKDRKLTYILSDCQAKILISNTAHLRDKYETLSSLSNLKHIVFVDQEISQEKDTIPAIKSISFKEMLDAKISRTPILCCIDTDLAALIYTSGSSGTPKGVMLTHHNMVSAAESIIQYLENTKDDVVIDTLPLSFDYGLYQVLMTFNFGGTVILENGFIFPEQIIQTVVKEKVTGWPIVPTIAALLCRQHNLSRHDFSRLRYITSTGQVLNTRHIAQLREAFPEVKIYSMYGLTECKRVSYLSPDKIDAKPESVGQAIPNTEVYIVDDDGNEITEAGKPGELVVRGSNVMQGYWNRPEATARTLRTGRNSYEKVLYTGDLFKKDQQGDLYFLGRKDDIIKTSGQMVSPKEIENVLCEMEDIVEAAVIGVEDEILGQAIKAYVHLIDGSKVTEREIIRFCYKHLEDYAVPKQIVFSESFPKTDNDKIYKRGLQ